MKSTLIGCACVVALFIAGCGNSTDGGNNNNGAGFLVPSGNYSMQQQLDPNETTHYSVGCIQAGNSTAILQIDPRLKVGMKYDYTFKGLLKGTDFQLSGETAVTGLTATSINENITVFSATGFSGINPGMTGTGICTLDNGAFNCVYNPQVPNAFTSFQSCTLSNVTSGSIAFDRGSFATQSGNTINAYRLSVNAVTDMTCGPQSIQQGAIQAVLITTNDIPSPDSATFCGGVAVFASLVVSGNGSAVEALSAERTGFNSMLQK